MDTNCCWVGYVVYSNGSSSEGGQKGSSAVAVSRRGLSPTPRPANVAGDGGLSSSGGWGNINVECNTVPASTGQKIIVGGDVLEVKEPTPKTTAAAKATGTNNTQSPAAPAAVDNAVNAAGGTAPTATTANAVWVHAEGSSGHELRDGFRRISEATAKKNRERARMWYMANRDRKAIAVRNWKQANREKVNERKRMLYPANREKVKEQMRRYCAANREKINERKRVWRAANREKINEQRRMRRTANREKIREARMQQQKSAKAVAARTAPLSHATLAPTSLVP